MGVIYQNKMIIYVVLARYYREGKRRGAFFYNDVSRKKEDESEGKKWREEGERKESAGRRQIFSTTTLSHSTFTFLSFFPLRLARSLNFSFSLSFSLEKAGEASQEETKRKRLESRAQLTPPPPPLLSIVRAERGKGRNCRVSSKEAFPSSHLFRTKHGASFRAGPQGEYVELLSCGRNNKHTRLLRELGERSSKIAMQARDLPRSCSLGASCL